MRALLSAVLTLGFVQPCQSFCVGNIEFNSPGVVITYSEDGLEMVLPAFILQIFETDGDISQMETYANIELAMNNFLLPELNAIYAPQRTVGRVNSTVFFDDQVYLSDHSRHLLPEHKRREPTLAEKLEWEQNHGSLETLREEKMFLRGKRNLQTVVGSQMLMGLNVTFERSPSPAVEEVSKEVKKIMQDLGSLVTNLTATMDEELQGVYMAIRLEIDSPEPSVSPISPAEKPVNPVPSPTTISPSDGSSNGNVSPPTKTPVAPVTQPIPNPTTFPIAPSTRTEGPSTPTLAPTQQSSPTFPPFAPFIIVIPTGAPTPSTQAPVSIATKRPTTGGSNGDISPPSPAPTTASSSPILFPTRKPIARTRFPVTRTPTSLAESTSPFTSPSYAPVAPFDNVIPTNVGAPSDSPSDGAEAPSVSPPSPRETPGIDKPIDVAPAGNEKEDGGNGMIIGAVVGTAAAAFVVIAALLLVRRRRNDDEGGEAIVVVTDEGRNNENAYLAFLRSRRHKDATKKEMEGDIVPLTPRSAARALSPSGRSVNDDSIFSGLTDILADTGSPRIQPVKSMSSATTVRANNVATSPFFGKSPMSTANGSALFAFSEGDEDSESVTNEDSNQPTEDLALSSKTPLRSNKANHDPTELNGTNAAMALGGAATFATAAAVTAISAVTVSQSRDSDPRDKVSATAQGNMTPSNQSIGSTEGAFPTGRNRQHAGKGTADGTSEYQEAMHPLDWSFKSDAQEDESSFSSTEDKFAERFIFSPSGEKTPLFSPRSERSKLSSLSGNTTPGSKASIETDFSASRQLINDLVWLERKIADVRTSAYAMSMAPMSPMSPGGIDHADSLSYASKDAPVSPSSHGETTTIDSNGIMQSIVCRDCYAPPGKLQIVIQSTKDGPAVHSVKAGSSLEGHLFPGDLIIAVDNVDTRTFKAEDVMKMMASKSGFERKITVLHYES